MTEQMPDFVLEGLHIYNYMKEKYPTDSPEDLDHILRTFSSSLSFLVYHNVLPEDYDSFLKMLQDYLFQLFNVIKSRSVDEYKKS